MKIYFAGSITGGRGDQNIYQTFITMLKEHGTVLTEHLGNAALSSQGESLTAQEIYERDMAWIREADVVVAEVSTPSLGVGYEIGQAEAMGKRILCLYRAQEGKRLSAMLAGNAALDVHTYQTIEDVPAILASNLYSR